MSDDLLEALKSIIADTEDDGRGRVAVLHVSQVPRFRYWRDRLGCWLLRQPPYDYYTLGETTLTGGYCDE